MKIKILEQSVQNSHPSTQVESLSFKQEKWNRVLWNSLNFCPQFIITENKYGKRMESLDFKEK